MKRAIAKASSLSSLKLAPVAVLVGLLAGCAGKPPPPPPPPVVVIPPQPQPPMGAPENMRIPEVAEDGTRKTVNTALSSAQAVWNLRSAFNVAALNCTEVEYGAILEGYKSFLKVHDKSLDRADADLKKTFTGAFGKTGTRQRETYQTQVYNFFAVPPVKKPFCDAAMQIAAEIALVPAGQLEGYAPQGVAKFEAPFMAFFDAYDQYVADLAAWRAKYGGIVVIAPEKTASVTNRPWMAGTPAQANVPTAVNPLPVQQPVTTPQPAITLPPVSTPAAPAYTTTPTQPVVTLPPVPAASR